LLMGWKSKSVGLVNKDAVCSKEPHITTVLNIQQWQNVHNG
jgi:hypothetical protein